MRFIYPVLLCMAIASTAQAGTFLMTNSLSSQGAVDANARVQSLGNTVVAKTIQAIKDTPSTTLLANYDVIWINPNLTYSGNEYLRQGVAGSLGMGGSLEQYVYNGGTLVINIASNSFLTNYDIAPGGVDYYRGDTDNAAVHNSEFFSTPLHPYLTGVGYGGYMLAMDQFQSWKFTDQGYLLDVPDNASIVMRYGPACEPTFIQYDYGCGTVILDTLTYGWGTIGARQQPLDNLINYALYASTQTDCDCNCVPEPSSFAMLGLAACFSAFGVARRRRAGATLDLAQTC